MAAIADHRQQQPANVNPRPARRSSGRRKAKGGDSSGQKKVKQPQRGMGVEKLERLRVREGLEKMAETLPDPVQTMDGFGSPAYLGFPYEQVDVFGNQGFVGNGATVVTCYSSHCNSCHKKKKFNGGDCGFMGEYHQKMGVVTTFGNIGKQGGVELVAVHRKGGGGGGEGGGGSSSGHVMMEYEFFPVSCKSDDSEELVVMKNLRDDSGLDVVDLSLKL